MRTIIWYIAIIGLLSLAACGGHRAQDEEDPYELHPTKNAYSPYGVLVPGNLDQCIDELDKMLPKKFKKDLVKEKDQAEKFLHRELAIWIRNNWGLWKGSSLKDYFEDIGITHADDMSSIVINSYVRHLNAEPIDLAGQIQFYKEFWEEMERAKDPKN